MVWGNLNPVWYLLACAGRASQVIGYESERIKLLPIFSWPSPRDAPQHRKSNLRNSHLGRTPSPTPLPHLHPLLHQLKEGGLYASLPRPIKIHSCINAIYNETWYAVCVNNHQVQACKGLGALILIGPPKGLGWPWLGLRIPEDLLIRF